jgi:hypothetical protein
VTPSGGEVVVESGPTDDEGELEAAAVGQVLLSALEWFLAELPRGRSLAEPRPGHG